ncbi:hypothetical protein E6P97_00735 [Patescibacteria group bacterium]|nr:MAG: hypothetical protein E6P97_00735 [Patescibacteria group bacterium]
MINWARRQKRVAVSPQKAALQETNLFLVRHATSDPERSDTLTPEGEAEAGQAAQRLQHLGFGATSLLIASPTMRTRQTAEYIAADFARHHEGTQPLRVHVSGTLKGIGNYEGSWRGFSVDEALGQIMLDACAEADTYPCHVSSVAFVTHLPLLQSVKSAMHLPAYVKPGEVLPYVPGTIPDPIVRPAST